MRQLLQLVFFSLALLMIMNTANATSAHNAETRTKPNTGKVYSDRLAGLDLPLSANMDAQLRRKIGQYVVHGGNGTELMLGRAEQYLPIFEFYLNQHNLPTSLKYLPVAESLLRARAVSSARAAGLWQLMAGTAREKGLRVNSIVDERLDAHLSTEAAVQILQELYVQFNDWNLVLAAYNCGPGRVRKAIRLSGSREYAKVKRYLPKETQQYVSAYLAAAYAVNFYDDHGLAPRTGRLNEEPLSYVRVYRQLSLRKVAEASGLDYRYLRRLNPCYLRGYVPKNNKGYRLAVPHHALYAVQRMVWMRDNLVEINRPEASPLAYQMAEDLGFNPYAWLFGCNQTSLLDANDLAWAEPAATNMVNEFFVRQQSLAMHP